MGHVYGLCKGHEKCLIFEHIAPADGPDGPWPKESLAHCPTIRYSAITALSQCLPELTMSDIRIFALALVTFGAFWAIVWVLFAAF